MIVKPDFLNKLKDFGLNSYESKLWTALLSRGVSTAGELSDIANVPRSRSYDVLESLEKKGFIIMKIGKPIKYVAVQPSEVLERVKKKVENDAEDQINSLNNIKKSAVLEELNNLHNQGIDFMDPTDLSGNLKGRDNLYNHLDTVIRNAKKSVILMTTKKGLLRKGHFLKGTLEKLSKKGVSVKIAAPLDEDTIEIVRDLSKYAEIKNTTEKSRFCVVDEKEVIFMLVDDETIHPNYDAGVWVNTPLFASTLQGFFDSSWSKLKPSNKFNKAM